MSKPSIPKGTRDFLPREVYRRQHIFSTIEDVFQKYAYQPIETPTMELLSTLTGKYGDEGDQLLFKVLNNGDFLNKVDDAIYKQRDSFQMIPQISKRGLRYDLTVPFARYVVMHQNDIQFPFKRYHIQPVWRADRPQKGRYQEFYQCDVDVVGSDSLMYEAELVKIFDEVFTRLGMHVIIHINNRKVLYGLAEAHGIADYFMDMTMAIDKLDKIGKDRVVEEMTKRGIPSDAALGVIESLKIESLDQLDMLFINSETGRKGVEELRTFHKYESLLTINNTLKFDFSLARGLNYYTGCIFEVQVDTLKHSNIKMGSIGGGGRYDDLTGVFGLKDVSGVGVSFGAERIYDVMEELQLFPDGTDQDLDVLLIAFDEESHLYAFEVLDQLRANNIASDLYPDPVKMKKQMKYADGRGVKYVIIIGNEEMISGKLSFKDMKSGEQSKLDIASIIKRLKA